MVRSTFFFYVEGSVVCRLISYLADAEVMVFFDEAGRPKKRD